MTAEDAHRAALAWFRTNWDPRQPLRDWWQLLADSGWGFPTWPEAFFGKGLDAAGGKAVARARREVGAFGGPQGIATMMVAPTLMEVGTPAQQQRYLPALANGTEIWCQLFSEPGAGSDLAGVQTRAVRDGDEWIVTGQKVWTSGGHYAKWAILVARTDSDVPKHAGLSFFLIDMDQPGVEVRPLRQMTGTAEFNEVFLTEARVRHDDLVGELGGGWGVALRLLGHERDSLDADADVSGIQGDLDLGAPAGSFVGGGANPGADDGTGPFALTQGQGAMDLVTELLADAGRNGDALARQWAASVATQVRLARYNAGSLPASAGKLAATKLLREVRDLSLRLLGPGGTLTGPDAARAGLVADMALLSPGLSIAGGTDEIQRNIIGERDLGLPPEPRVDKHVTFRELNQPGAHS
jgi:alkylation response protein AidB-like acyl-CoA dehydrogenase